MNAAVVRFDKLSTLSLLKLRFAFDWIEGRLRLTFASREGRTSEPLSVNRAARSWLVSRCGIGLIDEKKQKTNVCAEKIKSNVCFKTFEKR